MQDPFAVLGLDRGASPAQIKRAFRMLAMRWHPDRNRTREAEERFKKIKSAYELVLDPERLAEWSAAYAEAGNTEADEGQGGRDEDESDSMANEDASHLTLHLDLEEAAAGCTRTIALSGEHPCQVCDGKGHHEQAHSVSCTQCHGVGSVRAGRAKCAACGGRGYVRVMRCANCDGSGWQDSTRRLEVIIPPGLLPGERLRLARQHYRRDGAPAGDLFIAIAIRPHPIFALDGCDLECTMPIGIFRLLHGGPIEVPTLGGTQQVELQPYPTHGLEYSLPGLGYPGRRGRDAGSLHLRLTPVFPRHLDEAERKLLLRLDRAMLADGARSAPELAEWTNRMRARI